MHQSGDNQYLSNRHGHTPYDSMDSLDKLELELIQEEDERSTSSDDQQPESF
jgi:hypothetical protein